MLCDPWSTVAFNPILELNRLRVVSTIVGVYRRKRLGDRLSEVKHQYWIPAQSANASIFLVVFQQFYVLKNMELNVTNILLSFGYPEWFVIPDALADHALPL